MRGNDFTVRRMLSVGAVCCAVAFAAGCGSSDNGSSTAAGGGGASAGAGSSTTSSSAEVLGSPNPAKGTPVVFGAINIEASNGAAFPQVRQAMNATVKYVNEYRGGIGGHPIQIKWCISDTSQSSSANCAKKLIADKVTAILGAADLGAAVTMPIYEKADLAYVGGMNFTPAESTAKNSVIFNDVAQLQNVLNGLYAVKDLKGKKVAVIAQGDTQGEFSAKTYTIPAIKSAGGQAKLYSAPPSQADLSSVVASALSSSPDVIALESPSQCVALLSALKSSGNSKPVISIDPCSAPVVLDAASGGGEGMYFFSTFQLPSSGTPDSKLATAILQKYAPAKMNVDSPAYNGMNTIMNVQAAFKDTDPSKLDTKTILDTLRSGSDHTNFLAEPYTCNGKAIPALPAICNAKLYLYQIKNGKAVQVGNETHDEGIDLIK
jgi:branched-chain amino acid transport system substrate-binding protein